MCGILSIINKKISSNSESLLKACSIIKHRGPDDEGLLTWLPGEVPKIWAGSDTAKSTIEHWHYEHLKNEHVFKVGFGHRRLSILDLSPAGHQPMSFLDAGLTITFNGEIYNYLEIKEELILLGHQFTGTSDTEVILHSWAQWGAACLDRFNGMFAFVLLDYKNNTLYAVRDRFGVKPLFYYIGENGIYLSSEIKQIRTCPDYKFTMNEPIVKQYLATGAVDHTNNTFDTHIKHLPCGSYIQIDLTKDDNNFSIKQWYTLKPKQWQGSFEEASDRLRELLIDAVSLRLRSDVKVGSCLSGGLDSSSIVCIAAELLKKQGDFAGQETVTACYENARFDEWHFAEEVIKQTNAHPHKTFPSFTQLKEEIDAFLWHQDEPTGSTSQFSQWAVFKKTHDAGLKVMIDGQGADEQLAGYGGNDVAYYAGLMKKMNVSALLNESFEYKKENGNLPIGFIIGALQINLGKGFSSILPKKLRLKTETINWLRNTEKSSIYNGPAPNLQANLLRQLYCEPLPALLRYEDHNSMAWSVESRTPFLDYRFVEFTMGLPERFVYKNGLRKTILRHAMKNILPPAIEKRRDKMGFVTPEEIWLREEGTDWFRAGINETLQLLPHLFNAGNVKTLFANMAEGKIPFDFSIWRIVFLGRWYKMMIEERNND